MKQFLLLFMAVFFTSLAFSQDAIITKEGKKIESKVLEINENDIKYKNFDNPDGPIYTMKKSDIVSILYENGSVDVFTMDVKTEPAPVQQVVPNNTIYYTKIDYENARRLRDAGVGCFIGGAAGCTLGLILVVAGSTAVANNYYGYNDVSTSAVVGTVLLLFVGPPVLISGIVMWPIGQTRLNTINRFNPNGFTLYQNDKIHLNLAANGIKLNF